MAVERWKHENPPNAMLAIDPGASIGTNKVPYAGAALFRWGEMIDCALLKAPTDVSKFAMSNRLVRRVCEHFKIARSRGEGEVLDLLVVENPLIYKKSKARPQDIMELKSIYGAFMGGIDAVHYSGPSPGSWKGTIDGDILNERSLQFASKTEWMIVKRAGASSHVLDAMGLGFWALGRMDTGATRVGWMDEAADGAADGVSK